MHLRSRIILNKRFGVILISSRFIVSKLENTKLFLLLQLPLKAICRHSRMNLLLRQP